MANFLQRGRVMLRAGFHTEDGSYRQIFVDLSSCEQFIAMVYLVTTDFFEWITVNDVVVT